MNNSTSDFAILIVDDVPTNVLLVQAILKKEGYKLLTCNNGVKALRLAEENRPNLILLDIMMPGMDGYEVLQHLKGNPDTKDIPVIIMSALSDMQSIVKGYQLGATEYVTKPFQREELLKRVGYRYELFSVNLIKDELQKTIQSRDKLYSVIAHDLRSPLGALKMMANATIMMADKSTVGDEIYEMLQMMNKTTEDIFLLLDNLLKWTRRQLNTQKVFKENTDVNEIIRSVVDLFVPVAAQKKITLTCEGIDGEAPAYFDVEMLKTIIRNLLSNAIKFSFEGSTIDINTAREGDFIHISVKDQGKGIAKEDQFKVLDENQFYSTYGTNNEKGSGLGLMLSKEFVMQHNGRLWFESEEGKGTTFHFTLKIFNQQS